MSIILTDTEDMHENTSRSPGRKTICPYQYIMRVRKYMHENTSRSPRSNLQVNEIMDDIIGKTSENLNRSMSINIR